MWSDDGKPSHPWLVRPHAVSVKVNGKVRVLDRHTRRAAAVWVPLLLFAH